MYLPTTQEELKTLGWNELDVILISGDTYIDNTYCGVAIIGKYLVAKGYRVGVIAQPNMKTDDIMRLGTPKLYWGVSGGLMDSMVANYTASKKPRRQDDLTPGGINNRRPDRAVIAYCNLIKRYDPLKKPIVLGGVEASLRRIAHYDFWQDTIRKSILFDSKANFLIYGMGERAILELTRSIDERKSFKPIRGICYIDKKAPSHALLLPSFEQVSACKDNYEKSFSLFYQEQDYKTARPIAQQHGDRFLIHTPPQPPLTTKEMDFVYSLDYELDVHPYYKKMGDVRAMQTTQFSITTHRGCYGECNFCAIAIHQGKYIASRSQESILEEVKKFTAHPNFKGIINDVGGPTANMYGFDCSKRKEHGSCQPNEKSLHRCLYPAVCKAIPVSHQPSLELLQAIRSVPKIKKAFIASGIRYDLILADKEFGKSYLKEIVTHHVSGQMKIAPEHSDPKVLALMGKPTIHSLNDFISLFNQCQKELHTSSFLTYYFIAGHPGCSMNEMNQLKGYAHRILKMKPEQTQIFTPTPSTYSTVMFYTGKEFVHHQPIFIERSEKGKEEQKNALLNAFR